VTVTRAEPPPPEGGQEAAPLPGEPPRVHVVWLAWPEFERWLSGKLRTTRTQWGQVARLPPPWEPGQHWALIGPTGEGKSTFAIRILRGRKWVLALDPKGKDDTLEAAGWTRTTRLPPDRKAQKRIEEGKPVRLIVGGESRTDEQDVALQALMQQAIKYARHSGGWTLYVDEFELLSSQRMFRLGPFIERMLITARRDKTSIVTSFQAAAWVSKHATRQATLCTLWPTRDRDMIKAVAQSMGRRWQDVAAAIDLLPPFHVLVIPKQIRAPMIVTSAPKVTARRPAQQESGGPRGADGGPARGPARRPRHLRLLARPR
jgi:hypothetical protein